MPVLKKLFNVLKNSNLIEVYSVLNFPFWEKGIQNKNK